jgi:hypothetical protein
MVLVEPLALGVGVLTAREPFGYLLLAVCAGAIRELTGEVIPARLALALSGDELATTTARRVFNALPEGGEHIVVLIEENGLARVALPGVRLRRPFGRPFKPRVGLADVNVGVGIFGIVTTGGILGVTGGVLALGQVDLARRWIRATAVLTAASSWSFTLLRHSVVVECTTVLGGFVRFRSGGIRTRCDSYRV